MNFSINLVNDINISVKLIYNLILLDDEVIVEKLSTKKNLKNG